MLDVSVLMEDEKPGLMKRFVNFSFELIVIDVNLEFVLPSPWTMKTEQNLSCFAGHFCEEVLFCKTF